MYVDKVLRHFAVPFLQKALIKIVSPQLLLLPLRYLQVNKYLLIIKNPIKGK